MNRLFAIAAVAAAVVVVLLVVPDPSAAGPLKEIGKNTKAEVGALIQAVFVVAVMIIFAILGWMRAYPAMIIAFIALSVIATFVFDPDGAGQTLSSVGKSLMPSGK